MNNIDELFMMSNGQEYMISILLWCISKSRGDETEKANSVWIIRQIAEQDCLRLTRWCCDESRPRLRFIYRL